MLFSFQREKLVFLDSISYRYVKLSWQKIKLFKNWYERVFLLVQTILIPPAYGSLSVRFDFSPSPCNVSYGSFVSFYSKGISLKMKIFQFSFLHSTFQTRRLLPIIVFFFEKKINLNVSICGEFKSPNEIFKFIFSKKHSYK